MLWSFTKLIFQPIIKEMCTVFLHSPRMKSLDLQSLVLRLLWKHIRHNWFIFLAQVSKETALR